MAQPTTLPAPPLVAAQRVRLQLLHFLQQQPTLVLLLLLGLFASVRYEAFLTPENLLNVLRQNSMPGLLALAMLLSIISGGIDLSQGALLAVGGVVAASLSPYGSAVAIGGALTATTLLGASNGLLISRGLIQPFIATLVMNMASRGVLLAWTQEETVRVARLATGLKWLGRGWIGPVPVPALLFLVVYILAWGLLKYTRFGRHIYAVGDNEEAARLMGLNVDRVRIGVYALGGCLGGLAGVILAGRIGVGQPTAGLGWELNAITAVILGCTSLGWGQWGAMPTLIGVLLLAVMFNMFNLEGTINSYWQWVLRGIILLVVVVVQNRLSRNTPPG